MKMRCPWCAGLRVLISRMNHAKFYTCPLCRGKGFLCRTKAEPCDTTGVEL